MPPAGFKPTISASEWLQTHALDSVATGTGTSLHFISLLCEYWPNQPLPLVVLHPLPFGLELQELLRKLFPFPAEMDEFRFKAFSEECKPFWEWLMFRMLLRPFVLLAPLWRFVYSGNQAQQSEMGCILVYTEGELYRLYIGIYTEGHL